MSGDFSMRRHLSQFDNTKKSFDAICVSTDTNKILWIDGPKTEANAQAVVGMAIMRQGLEDRFFAAVPTGKFKVGDRYAVEHATLEG